MNPVKKRKIRQSYAIKPFPLDTISKGIYTGLDVEVFDSDSIKILLEFGSYGNTSRPRQAVSFYDKQPIVQVSSNEYKRKLEWSEKFGCDKSRKLICIDEKIYEDPFDIPRSIILFPEEAFFLHHQQKCLKIHDLDGKIVSPEELFKEFCEVKFNFIECYVAYLYFKSKNWVIKVGTKFGGNFLLYKHSPSLYHATFVVRVVTSQRNCYEHQSLERISETTKKCMIYLEVTKPDDIKPEHYLQHLDKFKVKEIAVKRLDMKEK